MRVCQLLSIHTPELHIVLEHNKCLTDRLDNVAALISNHSPTMAQTTTQRTQTQRVTRSQTLCTTPQLQLNTTASMDIDAGDTSTPIAATQVQMEVSPGLLPHSQYNQSNEPRSKRRTRSQTLCSRDQQHQDGLPDTQVIDATTQNITCSQNKSRRTSAGQTPRQSLNTITTDVASTAGTQTIHSNNLNGRIRPAHWILSDTPEVPFTQLDALVRASSLWHYKINTAAQLTPRKVMITMYGHHLQVQQVLDCQIYVNKKRKNTEEDQEVTHQKQYLVVYEPFITEKWALPIFRQIKDRAILMTKDVPRNNFLDASCKICCDPCTKEDEVQPTTDLYQ